MITEHETIDVFIGVDVGKSNHHAVALNRAGKKLLDKALPQDEAKLKTLIRSLAKHGKLLFVVDQPATIGALPVAVAQAQGIAVAYLPGLAMRRAADLHPGEAKTDARDAYIIATAARTLPQTLRPIAIPEEQVAELSMLCGFDDDLAKQATATSNRIRGLLTQIHPALERVIGAHLEHAAMAELLVKYPTPAALRRAGEVRIGALMRKHAPRAWNRWAKDITAALAAQTVVVSGTEAAGIVLPELARMLIHTRAARAAVLVRIEELVVAHPLHLLLDSMPGVGIRTQARILTEVVGKDFASPGHLASYAGLAPVTWRSGTSIRGDHASRKGNKILKRALFLSAFASLKCKDPSSRIYYDRKRSEGKKHNQALIALARRRCNVLFAMLRDGVLYQVPEATAA
ncbi:IS110 family transposase [Paeniglutamicibacter cryotolerans]|uniref:Transposase n=1 Tax=Paeniglutamicibacter cryotolerans TaxID=670079 RepID=A0A839QKL0_9MICC|nr:IS110 family transposase [Paeniglutamicibacter cryotolerans]MBB2995105.1 transposase [Paeniglutamicibacter cryotolerans]